MPQRIFKRKSSGKKRNLESNSEEPYTEERATGSKSDTDTSVAVSDNDVTKGDSIIPNRVFVGGIAATATEWELRSRFSQFGDVKAVKIIRDNLGISKGYGFITFHTEQEAERAIEEAGFVFKGRKMNIAQAIKKQTNRHETPFFKRESTESASKPYLGPRFADQRRRDNKGYAPLSDYPGLLMHEQTYPFVNQGIYADNNGVCLSTNDLQCGVGYGNPQMNLMPYPTLVYVSQQAYQYPGDGLTYPVSGSVAEWYQFVPTSAPQ